METFITGNICEIKPTTENFTSSECLEAYIEVFGVKHRAIFIKVCEENRDFGAYFPIDFTTENAGSIQLDATAKMKKVHVPGHEGEYVFIVLPDVAA